MNLADRIFLFQKNKVNADCCQFDALIKDDKNWGLCLIIKKLVFINFGRQDDV